MFLGVTLGGSVELNKFCCLVWRVKEGGMVNWTRPNSCWTTINSTPTCWIKHKHTRGLHSRTSVYFVDGVTYFNLFSEGERFHKWVIFIIAVVVTILTLFWGLRLKVCYSLLEIILLYNFADHIIFYWKICHIDIF